MKILKKTAGLAVCSLLAVASIVPVHAQEDYSDADAWYSHCSQVLTSQEDVTACEGFREYQNQRRDSLQQSIASFNESIGQLSQDVAVMEAMALEQLNLKNELQAQIEEKQQSIAVLEGNIAQTQQQIEEKQQEIDAWDGQIKSRMRQEQAATGTNSLVDVVMGSKSLSDLLRKITGIERITQSDQAQIEQLNALKAQLEYTRQELERLHGELQNEMNDLEGQRQQAQQLEEAYQQLVAQYEQQIAALEAEKRSAEADMDAIRDFTISVSLASSMNYSIIPTSSGFINPVPAGYASAGTWAYNSGGLHLGIDRAAPIGSDLIAPADGLIIYASGNAPTNGGYLGNWTGFPYGSGNAIEMLTQVNGTLYAISFFHLSSNLFVSAGQTVSQGQLLAQTGNSGNSSGPHTHIEVYNLGNMSMQEAAARFASNGDTAFGTGWGTTATACEYSGTTPCRERPEKFF